MITDREKLCALLFTGPMLRADALVVLCGEDAVPRYQTALELVKQDAAPVIVLSGGVSGDGRMDAYQVEASLVGLGLSPKRIVLEPHSLNTREQAVNVVALAKENGWKRLLLIASSYHTPRAFLTFLKALDEAGLGGEVHLVPFPASAPWHQKPEGLKHPRHKLLAGELDKVDQYPDHVATYKQGLAYLERWAA